MSQVQTVDIGVHQDGLVHVSALSSRFIKDPHEIVKAGQVVRVKVLEVDLKRQRIALTMRLDDEAPATKNVAQPPRHPPRHERQPEPTGAMATAFAKLKGPRL